MRNIKSSLNSRLSELEGTRGASTIILRFPDGSTRGVEVSRSHRLRLLLDTFDKARAYPPPPPPEGQIVDPLPPEPMTESDSLIDLLAGAESVEGHDSRLFQTIHGLCQQIGERRKEKLLHLPLQGGA
jgi:hypothetical protein